MFNLPVFSEYFGIIIYTYYFVSSLPIYHMGINKYDFNTKNIVSSINEYIRISIFVSGRR